MSGHLEFASQAWIDEAGRFLSDRLPALGGEVAGVVLTVCEVFTDPPAHLDDGQGRIAWWFRIEGPTATVGRGDRADADSRVELAYAEALPTARLVYDLDDPAIVARLREQAARHREEARVAGRPVVEVPRPIRSVLFDLHNHLAVRTA